MTTAIEIALNQAMRRHIGGGTLTSLTQLSGGASMESWSFDHGGIGYILRRAPHLDMIADKPFDHAMEASLVKTAHKAGVAAPEVVAVLISDDDLGSGYIMRRVDGEVRPSAVLAEADEDLIDSIAAELTAIHAIEPDRITGIPAPGQRELLDDLESRFIEFGSDRPIIALALKWCRDNPPGFCEPRLVHGDFRMGNLMIADGKVAAVLDWELAHLGDPHEDLAWGCVGAWRFGNYEREAFGLTNLDRYFTAYEKAGGGPVDRDRFRYWLIHRTIWWALGCLQMGAIWRSGTDRSLERAAIARRTIENEIDLLMLLEAEMGVAEQPRIVLSLPEEPEQTGETTSGELLEAIGEWIAAEMKPVAEGRNKFLSAVAINALKIAVRDLNGQGDMPNAELCATILSGETDLATAGLLRSLREWALRKGMIDVPKYSGLAAAMTKWT